MYRRRSTYKSMETCDGEASDNTNTTIFVKAEKKGWSQLIGEASDKHKHYSSW